MERGVPRLLLKPLGLHPEGHGGGSLFNQESEEAQILIGLAERALGRRDN